MVNFKFVPSDRAYFFTIRPFYIQERTNEAIEELYKHLEIHYPKDSWHIAGTDQYEIESIIYLHVIFNSEPNIVYEYSVEDTKIKQVDLWMLSGQAIEETGIEPKHEEK